MDTRCLGGRELGGDFPDREGFLRVCFERRKGRGVGSNGTRNRIEYRPVLPTETGLGGMGCNPSDSVGVEPGFEPRFERDPQGNEPEGDVPDEGGGEETWP